MQGSFRSFFVFHSCSELLRFLKGEEAFCKVPFAVFFLSFLLRVVAFPKGEEAFCKVPFAVFFSFILAHMPLLLGWDSLVEIVMLLA